jgi:hypothetical protein
MPVEIYPAILQLSLQETKTISYGYCCSNPVHHHPLSSNPIFLMYFTSLLNKRRLKVI